jgi:UDP-2,3-diacylglucosamine pyrophosphatase LpxH
VALFVACRHSGLVVSVSKQNQHLPNVKRMTQNIRSIVFSQRDLLVHAKSRTTVSYNDLHVTRVNEFAEFDFVNEYFRSDHFLVMLITKGAMSCSVDDSRVNSRSSSRS